MEEIAGSPSLNLAVERSLANFINQQGSQKMYALLDATEMLRQYTIVNLGESKTIEYINEELKKINFSKIKDYKKLDKFLDKVRKKVTNAQVTYELMKTAKDLIVKKKYKKEIANILPPFQKELYFSFMILLKISGVQNKTISRELLRTPEELKTSKESFDKKIKEETK